MTGGGGQAMAGAGIAGQPLLGAAGSAAAPPAPDGLVGHWRMDEGEGQVIFDATKNGNNGSIHYDHAWTDEGFAAAKFPNEGALECGGESTKVSWGGWSPPKMPQRTEILGLPALGSPMTATLWLRPKRVDVRQGIWLLQAASSSRLGIELGADGRVVVSGGTLKLTGPGLVAGRWQHAALVVDGNRAAVFVDGKEVASGEGAPPRGAIDSMTMGKAGSDAFGGTLDDARIYDRALTADEVARLASGS